MPQDIIVIMQCRSAGSNKTEECTCFLEEIRELSVIHYFEHERPEDWVAVGNLES